MNKSKALVFSFFVFYSYFSMAQDVVFSQYFASGQYFNPALVATETSLTLSGISRTQWKSVNAAYQTSMIGVTVPIKDKFEKHKRLAGVNGSIINDEASDGMLSTTGVNLTFSYGLYLSKKNMVFIGLMGGYYRKKINSSNFRWGTQYDPSIGWDPTVIVSTNQILQEIDYVTFDAGFLFVHDLKGEVGNDKSEIYLGVATANLNTPNNSLIKESNSSYPSNLPLRLTLNTGALLPVFERIGVSPNVLIVTQGQYQQYNLGVYGTYYLLNDQDNGALPNAIEFGTWHRFKDSFIFNLGIGNEVYHLGFSVDFTSSNLNFSSGNNTSYEISFKLQKPHKKTERHYTPRF